MGNIIRVHYICEITFDIDVYDALGESRGYPLKQWCEAEQVKKDDIYLANIFETSNLSEDEIQNIKNQINKISDHKYIYFVVGTKLRYIKYSNNEYIGRYSSSDYNSVFIYWANEPLSGGWNDGNI